MQSRVTWTHERVLRITTDIREPSTLFGTPAPLFVMMDSGRLYLCRDAGKGRPKTEPVWASPQPPIRVVITDAATGKSFAFARPAQAKGGRSVYFEIAETLNPITYDPARLKEVKAEEPLKSVLEHAALLRAEGQIRP